MSRENVELVWRAAKAFNDDDDLDWFDGSIPEAPSVRRGGPRGLRRRRL